MGKGLIRNHSTCVGTVYAQKRPGIGGPMVMESYLIRIYRRDVEDPEQITGTVEEIGTQESQGFKSLVELGGIITGKRRKGRARKRAVSSEKNP